jgi:hypothetical protein
MKENQIKAETLKAIIKVYQSRLEIAKDIIETNDDEDAIDKCILALRELDVDVPFYDSKTAGYVNKLHVFLNWLDEDESRDIDVKKLGEYSEMLIYVLTSFDLLNGVLHDEVMLSDCILMLHDYMTESSAIDDEDWDLLLNFLDEYKSEYKSK